MQIAICDDDPMIIKELQKDLEQYFRKHHLSCPPISQFTSGEALLNNKEEKDIVFLDVEMPGLNGIYVGNTLRKRYPNILIFIVTSFMEYLDDAMCFAISPNQLTASACSAIWMTRLRNTMHLPKRLLLKPKMGSTHLCHLPLL